MIHLSKDIKKNYCLASCIFLFAKHQKKVFVKSCHWIGKTEFSQQKTINQQVICTKALYLQE